MKKLLSALLAFALCASLFAGVGFTAAAESDLDRYVNATGGSIAFDNDAEYPWVYDTISIGKYGASAGNVGVDSSSSTISATINRTAITTTTRKCLPRSAPWRSTIR